MDDDTPRPLDAGLALLSTPHSSHCIFTRLRSHTIMYSSRKSI